MMTIVTEKKEHELTSKTLNNFLVSMRESVRQARVHLIHHHTRRIKALAKETSSAATGRRKAAASYNFSIEAALPDACTKTVDVHPINNKNKQKALKLGKEIKAVKSFSDGDLGKLVLLNTKTFNQAAREKCSAGQRAVCRLAEHEALKKCKQNFADKFGDSVKQLPFCIKVLGVSRRYKKLRKLDKRGKKEQFLESQRFCLRLLREIGGSDFASAEDLSRKMGKQKKKQQGATGKSEMDKASDGGDNSEGDSSNDDDDARDSERSSSDEEETLQQKEVKNKIHQKLDALLGKWDDDESDSDLKNASAIPRLTTVNDTIEGTKSSLANVLCPFKGTTKLGNENPVYDSHEIQLEIHQPCTYTSQESNGVFKQLQQSSTQSKILPIKTTMKKLELKDKKPSSINPSAFFASYSAKQIDLEKIKGTEFLPVSSRKRGRELNPEVELEELPRKAAERNKRRVLKRTAAEAEKKSNKEDDDDLFDPTKFNIRFNAKKFAEALLQKDDIRKPSGITARGSRGAGRRGTRGGALGNRRGGTRGRGGGAGEGCRRGARSTQAGSQRGGESERGRGRGAGTSNSAAIKAESYQSNEHLHPSWAAKKQQKTGIAGFQGKKIVFD